jgi:hypothetical protein
MMDVLERSCNLLLSLHLMPTNTCVKVGSRALVTHVGLKLMEHKAEFVRASNATIASAIKVCNLPATRLLPADQLVPLQQLYPMMGSSSSNAHATFVSKF